MLYGHSQPRNYKADEKSKLAAVTEENKDRKSGRLPSGLAAKPASSLFFIARFFFCFFVACACLAERSDATCIKTSTRHDLK